MGKSIDGGFLIVFEGVDGVGKSTQLSLAEKALNGEGWPTYTTRNLGGTDIGEKLRTVMLSPLPRPGKTNLYISVAIQEALIESVNNERTKNEVILLDRGPLSLAAYEVYGGGLDANLGWQHVDAGISVLKPDLTIIYTADLHTALERARQNSDKADYFESQPLDYFERVVQGYQDAKARYPNIEVIDANGPIEAVHEQTMRLIEQALAKRA